MQAQPTQKLQELQEAFTSLCIENREEERDLNIKNRAREEYILHQIKAEIARLISSKEQPNPTTPQPTAQNTRTPSTRFLDKRGDGIAVGDKVWILSTATTSFPGDLAEVTHFTKRKVHIKILQGFRKGHRTSRNSDNLLIDRV